MNKQAFDLIMARFDRNEAQNERIIALVEQHKKEDAEVHALVREHEENWGRVKKILSWASVPAGGAILAWLGLSK